MREVDKWKQKQIEKIQNMSIQEIADYIELNKNCLGTPCTECELFNCCGTQPTMNDDIKAFLGRGRE